MESIFRLCTWCWFISLIGSSDFGGLTTGFVYCLGALVLAGLSVINLWACNDLWTASEANRSCYMCVVNLSMFYVQLFHSKLFSICLQRMSKTSMNSSITVCFSWYDSMAEKLAVVVSHMSNSGMWKIIASHNKSKIHTIILLHNSSRLT